MKINKPKISTCTDKSLIDAYNEDEYINYKFTENIDESITINNIAKHIAPTHCIQRVIFILNIFFSIHVLPLFINYYSTTLFMSCNSNLYFCLVLGYF